MFSIITPRTDLKIVKRVFDKDELFVQYIIQRKFLGKFHWIDASQRDGFRLKKLQFNSLVETKKFIYSYTDLMSASYEEPIGSDITNGLYVGIVALSALHPKEFREKFTDEELKVCIEQTKHLKNRSVENILHNSFKTIEKNG